MEQTGTRHRIINKAQFARWMLLIGAAVVVGFGLLSWAATRYLDQLEQLSQADAALAAQRVSSLVQAVFVSSVVVALLVASFLAWYGYRAVRSECFPPPGSWVVEGRPVYNGGQARRRGWAQIFLGIFMAGVACAVVYRSWSLLQ
jgi:magnesium-transporting ATPase (P-type)